MDKKLKECQHAIEEALGDGMFSYLYGLGFSAGRNPERDECPCRVEAEKIEALLRNALTAISQGDANV